MTWLQKYRFRNFLGTSVWLPPLVGIVIALLANEGARRADPYFGDHQAAVAGAQTVLSALASAMLTFIVFVFSILLLAVQLASAQLTPRVIGRVYRSWALRLPLTLFVCVFVFDLAVLVRIDAVVPRFSATAAACSTVAAIGVFLYMIDRVGRALRPGIVLYGVGRAGRAVIDAVYPQPFDERTHAVPPPLDPGECHAVVAALHSGVVLAFDTAGLTSRALQANCVIELVPQVGDFVSAGDPLFRIYGPGTLDASALGESIAIGPERTLEQDPAFAFRVIVDVASKALSPAINDPTTAVLAIDQLHHLLRSAGQRNLETGQVHDPSGHLRLVYRTPGWEDLVDLAVTEIRYYGRDSVQVARRLRAMLLSLVAALPEQRAARLHAELALLERSVERAFPDPEDRSRASRGDSLGVGGAA